MHCVVHYSHLSTSSKIVPLDASKHENLLTNKSIRKELGGANEHFQQCESIPEILDTSIHGTHVECYKKFTKAKSIKKKKSPEDTCSETKPPTKRLRRSGEGAANLFPDHCMICKSSKPRYVRGETKKQSVHKLQADGAEEKLQLVAKDRNDEQMRIHVENGKLYEREFKVHDICYKEYTRPLYVPKEGHDDPFLKVQEFVKMEIIVKQRAVSMATLTKLYGQDENDRSARFRLKQRIEKVFPSLIFLSRDNASPLIVVNSIENITSTDFKVSQKEDLIKSTARMLREDILKFVEEAPGLSWPPKAFDLLKKDREGPQSVKMFLRALLQDDHHKTSDKCANHIWSFSQDLLHSVSNGTFITAKHVLIACTLHTMTGQKVPIQLLSLAGNCASYEKELEIETAQAEFCQKLISYGMPLPVQPIDPEKKALTHFWWDNFDCKKENVKGSVHTTHGVAFQELSVGTKFTGDESMLEKPSGNRSLKVIGCALPPVRINPHKPPKVFSKNALDSTMLTNIHFDNFLAFWKLCRRVCKGEKQSIPRFIGYVTKIFGKECTKTILTFLPPLIRPITEYSTVCETIYRSIKLSKFANMCYTHITVDIGAAEKYYKVIWNNQEEFKDVIIHLGDFHGMLHFFSNVGKFISSSGFQDILFQAGMCSDGCIKKILSGKAYNSCWRVHEVFAEAINRLFQDAFCQSNLSESLEEKIRISTDEIDLILGSNEFKMYMEDYKRLREKCLDGEFGATPHFWMLYQKMVDLIHQLHYAVNVNDYFLRLVTWEDLLKLSFKMNKQNYSRYGSYYTMMLRSIDTLHPGAREELQNRGLSVCRNENGIRQSIDGAGEQTFMRSSKTAGGIKNSVTQQSTYERWVMSRPGQAEFVMALKEKLGYGGNSSLSKCLRSNEMNKHERCVMKITNLLENQFINPFSSDLDKSKLYNLVSGNFVQTEVKDCLLTVFERGTERMEEFKGFLLGDGGLEKNIFTPIRKEPWKGFDANNKKIKLKVDGKLKEITAQRDILGLLVAKSDQENSAVDIEKALTSPLAPVSLSLACGDGGMRKTNKSKIYDFLIEQLVGDAKAVTDGDCYIVDLAAALRATVSVPSTFEELAMKILSDIPAMYNIVYFACDTYAESSIKGSERENRGVSDELILRSGKMKIPRDFQNFLNNGRNKERLFELFEETYELRTADHGRTIFFARRSTCKSITSSGVEALFEMNHEEADTKVVSLARHAMEQSDLSDMTVVVRSASGDVDIPVIMLASEVEGDLIIDNGRSNHRKILHLNQCTMTRQQKEALLGMHAFTGCDQNSAFFRKGKKTCWKTAQNYLTSFCELGVSYDISEQLYLDMERYVCSLYGGKGDDVNKLRAEIFWRTWNKKGQVIDLSVLPPCRSSLHLHIQRSNYIARIWRQANKDMMDLQPPQSHGWNEDFSLKWPNVIIPEDVVRSIDEELGQHEENDADDIYDTDSEDEDPNEEEEDE